LWWWVATLLATQPYFRKAVIVMAQGPDGETPRVDPVLLALPEMRAALAAHDIGRVFRLLGENGWTQRVIADATGMTQSSVSEIVQGRRVIDYRVLVRIADGLGIPRELMGLSAEDGSAYAGGDTVTASAEEVDAEVRRRALIVAGIAVAGQPFSNMGERRRLPGPAPVPLPSRILAVHVVRVRDLTQQLRRAGRAYGADPHASSAAAAGATRLLNVPGEERVKQALLAAVAEAHIVAGWAAFDAGLYVRAMHHYTRGLELATDAGDAYLQASALMWAGLATVEHGHPNDGLKLLQYAQVKAWDIPADEQRPSVFGVNARAAVEACARADAATALARLGYPAAADTAVAKAREIWQPTASDASGDLDNVAARLQLDRGRLDAAEPFAAAAVRRWERGSKRARTKAGILLATIHVLTGDSDGLALAHGAITGAAQLSSVRTRQQLEPLATALETRPRNDHRELAHLARQVAAMRA
jgi:transcriptional regulator with XRE-family HTH domain